MKKIKWLIVTLILFISTGCVKSTTTLSIGADKKVQISGENLIIDSMYDEKIFNLDNFIKNGGTIQKKSENGYSGVVFSKIYDNIDDISSPDDKEIVISDYLTNDFDDKVLFKVKSGFFKNIYYANYKFSSKNDINNDLDNNELNNNEDNDLFDNDFDFSEFDSLTSAPEFKYIVNLPVKSLSNNASVISSDEMTLTWNLTMGSDTNINFSFELINTNNIIFLIASIIVVLGIIIFFVIFLNKHKNDNSIEPNEKEPEILETDVIVNNDKMNLN